MISHSIEESLSLAFDNGEEEVFIIGGGQIYEQSQKYWDRIYLTQVDLDVEGDVFFPRINENEWEIISTETHSKDEKNEHDYTFKVLERINS
jgi:dihydrofolate reductase